MLEKSRYYTYGIGATKMTGTVLRIADGKSFGFIRADNKDVFFHRSDFNGHWDDLVSDLNSGMKVEVEFESAQSSKGPRASNVKRLDLG